MKEHLISATLIAAFTCLVARGDDHDSRHPSNVNIIPSEIPALQFQSRLPNIPGKTFTSLVVSFPPGARAVPHRHGQAFVYAYVLAGVIRSQIDDRPAVVYTAGQDWSELPGAHHVLTENVSAKTSARLLVVFVADTDAELKVSDQPQAKP